MATTTGIKFYAGSYGRDTAVTKATNGAIVFDKTTHSLFVDGIQFGGNIADAEFSNNVLTITKADGTSQIQLDFSSLATTSSVMAVFKQIGTEIDAIETSSGLGTDGTYTADSTTNYLTEATSLKDADKKLDAQLKSVSDTVSGLTTGVSDVQINSTSIKSNGVADIAVDGTYNASTNKIATESTVTDAIDALDVNSFPVLSSNITDGVLELTTYQIGQTDGKISRETDDTITFAKVATTGAAGDVSIADSGNLITATTVEGALAEIAGEIDGMDLTATALMTKSDDTTNGNTTFTISGIQEVDGVVSLASTGNATFKTDGVYSETSGSENLIATKATVTAAVNAALDSEVTFQGVTSTLPSTPTNGDMYKASAAISIPQASAGQGEAVTTKAGDTIIYKNVTGAQNNGWYVIPSGDESMTDTWRAISVNGAEALGSGLSTGGVNFANGTLTTVSESSGTITVNHATPTAASDNLAALKIQLDSYGHIVGTSALTIGDLGGLASVSHGTDGSYITTSVGTKDANNNQKISASLTIQAVSTASSVQGSEAMGLAEASDVKAYVDAHTASVTNNATAIPVNGSAVTLATVDGTNITASATFYWEEYA